MASGGSSWEGTCVVVDGGEVACVFTVEGEEGPPFTQSPPQAMASPKPNKPVQPAPSSRMRLGRLVIPVCLSRPKEKGRVGSGILEALIVASLVGRASHP